MACADLRSWVTNGLGAEVQGRLTLTLRHWPPNLLRCKVSHFLFAVR